MKHILHLAWRSIVARRSTAILTLLAVALSVALFAGVEKTRRAAADSFFGAVSDVDVIVGAPTGPVNLLLFSIFHIGNATSPISYGSYETISARPEVEWAVPISMGDSHRGYRVVGTTPDYFQHVKYADKQSLAFRNGGAFDPHELQAVIGASVARDLGYTLDQPLVISHGLGNTSFVNHDENAFRVVGVLKPTGTPIDQSLYISLEGIERMHGAGEHDHEDHTEDHHDETDAGEDHAHHDHLEPGQLTAILVSTKAPALASRLTYTINMSKDEPLLAISPALTLDSLWKIVGVAERALMAVSVFVLIVGLATILIAILTSLNERRREMAILRATGARPHHIFALIVMEAFLLAFIGAALGLIAINLGMLVLAPLIQERFGLALSVFQLRWTDAALLLGTPLAAALMALWPASRALKNALADGLSMRI
ncbi:MAG: hypothetical protein CME88_16470 [Hirschia sp.]|nr:hypothetical protein [Hirschia sp.]MBF19971.1 hypothetical protein [Hirschia sp.]